MFDYLIRYLYSIHEIRYGKQPMEISIPKELYEHLIIQSKQKEKIRGALYGINLVESEDVSIRFK